MSTDASGHGMANGNRGGMVNGGYGYPTGSNPGSNYGSPSMARPPPSSWQEGGGGGWQGGLQGSPMQGGMQGGWHGGYQGMPPQQQQQLQY